MKSSVKSREMISAGETVEGSKISIFQVKILVLRVWTTET